MQGIILIALISVFATLPSFAQQTLRIGFLRENIEFRPVKLRNQYDDMICQQVYQTLFSIDNDGQIYSDLVAGIKTLNDQQSYVFELNKNIKFSNNVKLNASHVVKSINAHLVPGSPSILAQYLRSIIVGADQAKLSEPPIGLKVISEFKIRIDLNYSYPDLIKFFAAPGMGIEYFEEEKGLSFGSGPFKIARIEGTDYTLERNPYYSPHANIKKIKISVVDDPKLFSSRLGEGKLDFVIGYPKDKSFQKHKVTYFDNNIKFYFSFNPDLPLFQDKELRKEVWTELQSSAKECAKLDPALEFEESIISPAFLPARLQAKNTEQKSKKSLSSLAKLKEPISVSVTNLVLSNEVIGCLEKHSHKNIQFRLHSPDDFDQLKYNRRFDIKRFVYRPDFLSATSLVFPFQHWLKSFDAYYNKLMKDQKKNPKVSQDPLLDTLLEYRDDYWLIPVFQIRVPIFHTKNLKIKKMKYVAFPNLQDIIRGPE